MATPGFYPNPSYKPCWDTCSACMRCSNKGMYAKCNNCSGRHDPRGITDPHPDDWCNCTEGVLRFVKQNGERVMVRYKSDPFGGKVITTPKTQDEHDWAEYLTSIREKYDNPDLDPIKIV